MKQLSTKKLIIISIISFLIILLIFFQLKKDSMLIHFTNFGSITMVKLLVAFGADVNLNYENTKYTLLDEVWLKKTKGLLNLNIDIYSLTPLMVASLGSHTNIAKYLIDKSFEKQKLKWGDVANFSGYVTDIMINGKTALSYACYNGHQNMVKLLINKKASHHGSGKDILTPLMWASLKGHADIVRYLLSQRRIDVGKADEVIHNTALNYAFLAEQYDVVNILLTRCNINKELLNASKNGYNELIQLLIKKGANPNCKFSKHNFDYEIREQNTPLIISCKYGNCNCIKTLINSGANVNYQGNNNNTAL